MKRINIRLLSMAVISFCCLLTFQNCAPKPEGEIVSLDFLMKAENEFLDDVNEIPESEETIPGGEQLELHPLVGTNNGTVFTNNLTLNYADSMAVCSLQAASNPTAQVRCVWKSKVIFLQARQKAYVAKVKATIVEQITLITLVNAKTNCNAIVVARPGEIIRCTWGENEIFSNAKLRQFIATLNGRVEKNLRTATQQQALSECALLKSANPSATVTCSWGGYPI